MAIDKWFDQQSRLVQILLLVFPVVGWVMEILIRLSIVIRTKKAIDIVVFIIFVLAGWAWLICLADMIYLICKNNLILQN
jgi:hypothetical protein